MKNRFVALASGLMIVGCSTGPRGFPPTEGISNFDRVNAGVYRGAQPNALAIRNLQRVGIKTIVNLRMPDDAWFAEESEARANGILYTNVPMSGFGRPKDGQVARVLSIIEGLPAPVYVHCKHGCDRTGTIIACYRIRHDHWTADQALAEAREYGMARVETGMRDFVRDFAKSQNPP